MFRTIYNEKEKLWTGLRTVPVYNENLSVGQAIIHSLDWSPYKIGQVGLTVHHCCLQIVSVYEFYKNRFRSATTME